ncbi:MAG: hypothetical protein GY868_21135 [Deltaproteobacteria bacterium]|nr:hypothetical protein [Deltaproteobacteria bacterium]
MYELVRGPLLLAACIIAAAGVVYRTIQLYLLTRRKDGSLRPPVSVADSTASSLEERKLNRIIAFQNSLLGKHPVIAIVSTVFHVCLFATPVFLNAHMLILYESWGFNLFSLPDKLCDILTITFLVCAFFFLMRRLVIPKVRAITSGYDYLLLLVTAAPFLSGFFAYHQWFDYHTIIVSHILTGELMLIAIPFTKLGHMVFFFFVRILIGSEHSFAAGRRIWRT